MMRLERKYVTPKPTIYGQIHMDEFINVKIDTSSPAIIVVPLYPTVN